MAGWDGAFCLLVLCLYIIYSYNDLRAYLIRRSSIYSAAAERLLFRDWANSALNYRRQTTGSTSRHHAVRSLSKKSKQKNHAETLELDDKTDYKTNNFVLNTGWHLAVTLSSTYSLTPYSAFKKCILALAELNTAAARYRQGWLGQLDVIPCHSLSIKNEAVTMDGWMDGHVDRFQVYFLQVV